MSDLKKYGGVVVPMLTPLTDTLAIDETAAEKMASHVIRYGAFPFILGTTGESASIPRALKSTLVRATVTAAAGKSVVYAGISGNALYDSVEDAKQFHDLGADVFVATMPGYYPVDTDQIRRYFTELADSLPAPLIIYNIPATTHLSIPLTVVEELSHHPNIAGFKDSERSIERLEQSVGLWKDRTDFSYMSGWAAQSHLAMTLGADGIVPSTGNLTPLLYQEICNAAARRDDAVGQAAQDKADRISAIYQQDRTLSRSLPVFKVMMELYGLCRPHMLPPLYEVSASEKQSIKDQVLAQFGDLNQINSMTNE